MQVNPPLWPENPLSHQMKHKPGGIIYYSDKSEPSDFKASAMSTLCIVSWNTKDSAFS